MGPPPGRAGWTDRARRRSGCVTRRRSRRRERRVERVDPAALLRVRGEARLEAVSREGVCVLRAEGKRLERREKVSVDVTTEVRRVIRVDGRADACIEQRLERMMREIGIHAELD